MAVAEIINKRRSIRKYKKGAEVSDEQIRSMLEAAMMAPSAANGRPWEFVVVRDRDVMEKMMGAHPWAFMLESASLAIVVCGLPDAAEPSEKYFPQDCGAATQNILLQAGELGLGACWCGVYPSEGRAEQFQEILGVGSIPICLIAVGVPDESPAAKGFFDPAKVKYI